MVGSRLPEIPPGPCRETVTCSHRGAFQGLGL